jgi:hypothetical protein
LKALIKVFTAVFVRDFFRINVGFFFVCTGICFGFLSGREHLALAQSFISSFFLFLIPLSVWILYLLKVINFNTLSFVRKENSFFYTARILPHSSLWICLLIVAVYQLLPILLYAAFLVAVAIQQNQLSSVTLICLSVSILTLCIAYRLYLNILYPSQEKKVGYLKNWLDQWITKPYSWFFPEWILRTQPLLVIGTKLFASLLIVGVARLYSFDEYDERLLAMGSTLAFAANLAIVYYYHRFENFHLRIVRSLPFSLPSRVSFFLLVIGLLSLPEWGVLITYFPKALPLVDLILIALVGYSIYFLGYAYLFRTDITLEKFIGRIFTAAFFLVIAILFKVPVLLIALVLFSCGYFIYKNNFYRFEFNEETGSEK